MYWKDSGVAHRIKERMNSNLRKGKNQGQNFRRPQQRDLWTTSLGAAIMLILLQYSSFWVYETVQVSSSRRDHWLCLGQGPILQPISLTQQKCSHWLPPPMFGDVPRKGRFVVNWGTAILLGVYYSGCLPPCPRLISNKEDKEKLSPRLSWGNHFFFW